MTQPNIYDSVLFSQPHRSMSTSVPMGQWVDSINNRIQYQRLQAAKSAKPASRYAQTVRRPATRAQTDRKLPEQKEKRAQSVNGYIRVKNFTTKLVVEWV